MTTISESIEYTRDSHSALRSWVSTQFGRGVAPLVTLQQVDAFERLRAAMPVRSSSYYAEVRLQGPQQLDLLFSLDIHASVPTLSTIATRTIGRSCDASTAWSAASRFLERWMDTSNPMRRLVSTVWLEFDDVERPDDRFAPSLSACLVPSYDVRKALSERAPEMEEHSSLAVIYLGMTDGDHDRSTLNLLRECVRALPRTDRARFIHLSTMSARETRATKLYGVVPRLELAGFLRRIGWTGSYPRLADVLERLMSPDVCGDDLYFDLNLATFRDPEAATLGLAYAQQHATGDKRRTRALRRLIDAGYCTVDAARNLRAWPEPGLTAGRRWLDLKLVMLGDQVVAKAYLGEDTWCHPLLRRH